MLHIHHHLLSLSDQSIHYFVCLQVSVATAIFYYHRKVFSCHINESFHLHYKSYKILLIWSWVNGYSGVRQFPCVLCSAHAIASFMIFLSYSPSSHSYFSGNYNIDNNFDLIEKGSNFAVPQWKQYKPLMIIIPLVPSHDKIFQLHLSGGVLSLAIRCYIWRFLGQHWIILFGKKRRRKNVETDKSICITLMLPDLNLGLIFLPYGKEYFA